MDTKYRLNGVKLAISAIMTHRERSIMGYF